jgi:predicted nucleic acid-binding protein
VAGIVLDTGALVALERRDRRIQVIITAASQEGVVPIVPTQVLAQYWRGGGGHQAVVARFLHSCQIEHLDIDRAKQAGMLLGRSCTSDEADAVVALIANECGAVVTSDRHDIMRLLRELHSTARVLHV